MTSAARTRCLVLNALPLTWEEFRSDYENDLVHEFVSVNARGIRADAAWTGPFGDQLRWCREVLDVLAEQPSNDLVEVECVPAAGIASFSQLREGFDVVILVAHWKGHEVQRRDFAASGTTATEVMDVLLSEPDERLDAPHETFLEALRAHLESLHGERSIDLRSVAERLDDAVCQADFIDLWSDTAIRQAPNLCRAANRSLLDRILGDLISPGNRVELRDGMHSAESLVSVFPEDWHGTLDLTVCQSELLAAALKEKCPGTVCVQTNLKILVGPRVQLSATVIDILKICGGGYATRLREVLNELAQE